MRSDEVKKGHQRTPHRSLFRATGLKDEDFAKINKLGMWSMTFQYPWDFRKGS